jgi:uncharacterized protein (DUF1501 family)
MGEHEVDKGGRCAAGRQADLDRRSFLKRLLGATALTGLAAEGLSGQLAFAAPGYTGDVLVVLSLRGGFDGLNAVVPTSDPRYRTLRPRVGIPQSTLVQLDHDFGMHPAMRPLKPFWDAGTFGVVHAVGMGDPTRSHFQAMAEMERAAPGTSLRTGWIDRTLGLRGAGTILQGVQLGQNLASSSFVGPSPELALRSVDEFVMAAVHGADDRRRWRQALAAMNANAPTPMAQPASAALQAVEKVRALQVDGYQPVKAADYPKTDLGRALKDVARLVKADVGLQVACVDYGDWDMHARMGTVDAGWFYSHVSELARAMAAFGTDLGRRLNRVTLVTLSEFGRRVKENGSGGTDHGHGQAVLMLGGGVVGGRVHGRWPGLADADLVDGDLAGTTDYRALLAEVLEKRCGTSEVSTVFPGLGPERLGVVRVRA